MALVGGSITVGMGAVAGEPSYGAWLAVSMTQMGPEQLGQRGSGGGVRDEGEAGVGGGGALLRGMAGVRRRGWGGVGAGVEGAASGRLVTAQRYRDRSAAAVLGVGNGSVQQG